MEHWEGKERRAKAIAKKKQGKIKYDMFFYSQPRNIKKHRILELRQNESAE
jgi:hypothetical protein